MNWNEVNQGAWALWREGRVREALGQWSELQGGLRRAGRLEEARGVACTLLQLGAAHGGPVRLVGYYAMAETAREAGEFGEAERWIVHAFELHRREGDVRGEACDLASLGELAEDSGDWEGAVGLWNQALELLDSEGSCEAVHDLQVDLARVYTFLGRTALAQACAGRAEQLAARWAD